MAFLDLRALHRLHLVDQAIVEIRKRAAALDPGRTIHAEIKQLEAQLEEVGGRYRALSGEQSDLELQQQAIDAKLAQIDKDLYGGKVVNPREVENLNKEIEAQKRRRSEIDDRLLELLELVPPAKVASEAVEANITEKQKELVGHQKAVMAKKADLEQKFKEATAKRGPFAQEVPVAMLSRYDAIRQKSGGIGMSDVVRGGFCEMCGTHLPEKLIEAAKEGRIATCEACHRILYASEGLI